MNKSSKLQKNNSKKFLIKKLEKDLKDLTIKHNEQIKEFKTKELMLKHLINVVEVKPYVPNDGSILCQNCKEPFFRKDSPLNVYCSYDCQKEGHLNQNKNPFTKTSIKERRLTLHRSTIDNRTTCSYDEVHLPENVAMFLDCLPEEKPFTIEDEQYLKDCFNELPIPRYADGRVYISPKNTHKRPAHTTAKQSKRAYRHRLIRKDY